MDDLYSLIANIDPDLMQQLVSSGLTDQRMGLAQQGMGIGNELMNTPGAEGRTVGRTYVASSPLEHLAVALRRTIGARDLRQGQQQQADLLGQRGTALGGAWQAIQNEARRRQQQVPSAQPPPVVGMDYSQT